MPSSTKELKIIKTLTWHIGERLGCRSSCVISYAYFKNDLQNIVWILYEHSTSLIFIKAAPLFSELEGDYFINDKQRDTMLVWVTKHYWIVS